jgi:hypothetical protein
MDGGEEVSCSLVVAGSNGAELFEPAEEVLDAVTCLIQVLIVVALHFAIRFGWNHRRFSSLRQPLQNPFVGIVALVGQHDGCFESRQQCIGPLQITSLSGGQQESCRIPQGINSSMDFGAQPAFTASNRLVFPLFF